MANARLQKCKGTGHIFVCNTWHHQEFFFKEVGKYVCMCVNAHHEERVKEKKGRGAHFDWVVSEYRIGIIRFQKFQGQGMCPACYVLAMPLQSPYCTL